MNDKESIAIVSRIIRTKVLTIFISLTIITGKVSRI